MFFTMLTLISFLVCVCVVLIFRFLNEPHNSPILGVYQQQNKYYWLKFGFLYVIFSIRQLWKYLKRRMAIELGHSDDGTIQVHNQETSLEEPFYLGDHPLAADDVHFNGTSKTGAIFSCGVSRRQKGECNAFLYLKVDGGELLLSPSLPDTNLKQSSQEEGTYNVAGLKITNLIPMRTWTVKYSGDLKTRGNSDMLSKVELSLTWSTAWMPFNYDTQMSPYSMAQAMAKEMWSTDYFKLLQRFHRTHYEQMGIIEGNVSLNGVEHKLSMPCVRDHIFSAHRDWRTVHRFVYHLIYLENGDCIAVGSLSQPVIFSHINLGYICTKSDNAVLPIKDNTFLLYQHGEQEVLPKDYGFTFTAGGKSYAVQVVIKDENVFYSGKDKEGKFYERWASYEVNGIKGWGTAEWYYRNLEQK